MIELPLEEVTSTALQRAFAEIAQQQSDAVIVNSNSLLAAYRQLIVELAQARLGLPSANVAFADWKAGTRVSA